MENQCKICNNVVGNEAFIVREMMFGTRENFNYFKCSSCGCLQIDEIPTDISKFYSSENYYSYQQSKKKHLFQKLKCQIILLRFNLFFYWRSLFFFKKTSFFKGLENIEWLKLLRQQKAIKKTSAILDIGCGAGHLLQEMNTWRFKNLTGIDPFIESDIFYPSGIKILKQDVFSHNGMYDLIMLHHSFEHMDAPAQVLKRLHEMLNSDGFLLIRIPVSDCFAWRKYGVNWFQIDAPRHFFLHTTRSMTLLGKDAGFLLKEIACDSTEAQFLESEKYCRDVSLLKNFEFSNRYISDCKKQTRLLNRMMDGDQACFVFQKK